MKFKTFEITKREFLVSIIIACMMIVLGFFIDDKVQSKFLEDNERYYKATKINNDKDLFDYAMETSAGDSLISGRFKSVDSVSIEELKGDYWFIERTEENTLCILEWLPLKTVKAIHINILKHIGLGITMIQ